MLASRLPRFSVSILPFFFLLLLLLLLLLFSIEGFMVLSRVRKGWIFELSPPFRPLFAEAFVDMFKQETGHLNVEPAHMV
jgi:hypothetical protein